MVDCVLRSEELAEVEQLEAVGAEDGEQVARAGMELDLRVLVQPLELVEALLGPQELFSDLAVVGHAEDLQGRAPQEDELAAVPQEPGRLRDPERRIAPDRRPVLREREVEGLSG